MIRIRILNRKRLTEVNVTSMSQRYRVPLKFANAVANPDSWHMTDNEKEMEYAKVNVELFMHISKIIYGATEHGPSYEEAASADLRKEDADKLIDSMSHEVYSEYPDKILKLVSQIQKEKIKDLKTSGLKTQLLNAKSINDVDRVVGSYQKILDAYSIERFQKTAVITFNENYFWSKLDRSDWPACGVKMKHCGRPLSEDGEIYQLFEKTKKENEKEGKWAWKVTIEMRPNKDIIQIKGEANTFPEEAYWEAIYAFINKYNAKNKEKLTPSNFGSRNYIIDEAKERLEKIYKAWQNNPELQKKFDEIKDKDPDDRKIGPDAYHEFRRFAGYIESVYEDIWENNLDDQQEQIIADAGFKITELHHYDKVFYSIQKLS